MSSDPRQFLEQLCQERGEDFASLSHMLGKNPAYIQQYIRRGVPKRLKEEERRKLAQYFGVSEHLLGGPLPRAEAALVPIQQTSVYVSAGPGQISDREESRPYMAFDEAWLKRLTQTGPENLSIVRVKGDSMASTLNDGDDILVDHGDCGDRIRDGIYVIRMDHLLVVKRIAINPMRRTVTLQSDNPAYPDWPDCEMDSIDCIGRVIWSGRKLV
jgi:phage repressor protein C with HTH and peptisase S24 domain